MNKMKITNKICGIRLSNIKGYNKNKLEYLIVTKVMKKIFIVNLLGSNLLEFNYTYNGEVVPFSISAIEPKQYFGM